MLLLTNNNLEQFYYRQKQKISDELKRMNLPIISYSNLFLIKAAAGQLVCYE